MEMLSRNNYSQVVVGTIVYIDLNYNGNVIPHNRRLHEISIIMRGVEVLIFTSRQI